MARPRKARVEGAASTAPTVGHPASDDLTAIVAAFKAAHPDEWGKLHLCPLEYGLAEMARLLK